MDYKVTECVCHSKLVNSVLQGLLHYSRRWNTKLVCVSYSVLDYLCDAGLTALLKKMDYKVSVCVCHAVLAICVLAYDWSFVLYDVIFIFAL